MFNLKFAKKYNFSIMETNNIPHVFEDFFKISSNAFCIADGITRDLLTGEAFFYPKTTEEALELIKKYPNPSGASKAAQTCAENFIKYISKLDTNIINKNDIFEIVKKVNFDIAQINKNRNIDYVVNDYYACVAVGGIFFNNMLYCFAIGDSKIQLLDENLNTLFDTSDSTETNAYNYSFSLRHMQKKYNWNDKKYRKFIRRNIRNNVFFKRIKKYTFGALTGEKKSLKFVKVYQFPLENVKYIIAYSDGCEELLKSKEQIIDVLKHPEQIVNETHEKTLIIYEKDISS